MKIFLAFLLALPAWAAIPTATMWEIRSSATASNVNGGGFNYAHATLINDLACTSATGNAPVCSSATYNFVAGDADAWLFVQSGTNWYANQFCPIASVASNQATLNATIGACVILSNNRWIANTVAGVASTASPTGGVFGVDFSQQDTAELTNTDGASSTTSTTFTSAGSTFRTIMRGNVIHITTTGTGAQCIVGWYHVESVTDANNVVLDRAPSAGSGCAAATWFLGGAFADVSDAIFELATSSATAANRYFVKAATYTVGAVTVSTGLGNAVWPVVLEGYSSLRGDRPVGATRPVFAMGTATFTPGAQWDLYSLSFTGTAASVLSMGSNSKLINVKCVNSSTTADRVCITPAADYYLTGLDVASYRGLAVSTATSNGTITGSYLHDSNVCFSSGASSTGAPVVDGNIMAGCILYGVRFTAAATNSTLVQNNTIYGFATPIASSVGISFATGVTDVRVRGNIVSGFSTGIAHADAQSIAFSDFNNLYNNTTASSNWQSGANSRALDPQFTSVAELSGSTATTSGSVLTQSGGDFSTVVDGRDFLYLISGTGITAGIYGITSHTADTLTLDIAPGTNATTDKVWRVLTGRNFAIGTNLKALGFPGAFPAALTTAYTDIGGVQRQESGGGSSNKAYPILK